MCNLVEIAGFALCKKCSCTAATTAVTSMALGQTNLVLAHAIEDIEDTPMSWLEEERME